MKLKAYTVLLFLIVSGQKIWAQGCSQCKLVSEQATELDESSFGTNINSGILYLMIIPYLLIFFLFRKRIISFFKSM
ncbi:MAG: hypothetical protein EB100_04825, partial [Crocinitomicaceae bacterium]|nr:hypothetical protein [Crocinitomicaceae bacterium]